MHIRRFKIKKGDMIFFCLLLIINYLTKKNCFIIANQPYASGHSSKEQVSKIK